MDPQANPQKDIISGLPKAYDPGQYAFIGFIFSLIPVFVMSLLNSRILENGKKIAGTMKKFLAVYVGLFLINHVISIWAVVRVTKAIVLDAMNDSTKFIALMRGGLPTTLPADVSFAQAVVQNSSTILFVANIILLFFVIKFTNRNELPIYREMREAKKLETKNLVVPVLIGIAFLVYSFGFYTQVITAVAKMFL